MWDLIQLDSYFFKRAENEKKGPKFGSNRLMREGVNIGQMQKGDRGLTGDSLFPIELFSIYNISYYRP